MKYVEPAGRPPNEYWPEPLVDVVPTRPPLLNSATVAPLSAAPPALASVTTPAMVLALCARVVTVVLDGLEQPPSLSQTTSWKVSVPLALAGVKFRGVNLPAADGRLFDGEPVHAGKPTE